MGVCAAFMPFHQQHKAGQGTTVQGSWEKQGCIPSVLTEVREQDPRQCFPTALRGFKGPHYNPVCLLASQRLLFSPAVLTS